MKKITNFNDYTQKEIDGQPDLWEATFHLYKNLSHQVDEFLKNILQQENIQIVLTGAGSSAFVGEAAQGLVQQYTKCNTKAIATTDLVTHHQMCLQQKTPILLVSFARSGNSPESVEAVKLADEYCDKVYHLIITCNKEGKLFNYSKNNKSRSFAFLLPEEANDKSLAMTGSFTSMLLSILLIFKEATIKEKKKNTEILISQGKKILVHKEDFKDLAELQAERVVFLGSGPMLGIARECHLKLQELTDGKIICKHDSFLGFRHGPRAVINEDTLIVYLFASNAHVFKYERDLAISIAQDKRRIRTISLGKTAREFNSIFSLDLDLSNQDEFHIVSATLIGQLLGYYTSMRMGLNPDNPSVSGAISRVVEGVHIYERSKTKESDLEYLP
ncbi:SIS domain-containing protein [Salegentibacter sp. LM13S]|uniref:SIS domain-containing protein n=1 Tax=Salegentibacter lacus TaxID=2873599 RepID=UPI001CCA86FA|nr:SIS domain-containing protein [Salegentibacter lacus]MBZ9630850.1 SIS domain-containing protein [Salegentibacter lacus]